MCVRVRVWLKIRSANGIELSILSGKSSAHVITSDSYARLSLSGVARGYGVHGIGVCRQMYDVGGNAGGD